MQGSCCIHSSLFGLLTSVLLTLVQSLIFDVIHVRYLCHPLHFYFFDSFFLGGFPMYFVSCDMSRPFTVLMLFGRIFQWLYLFNSTPSKSLVFYVSIECYIDSGSKQWHCGVLVKHADP